MKETYDVVPDIISSKDLDYLSDMFNWTYGAYKCTYNAVGSVKDETLKKVLEKATNIFEGNMNKILNILCNGGSNE